MSFMQRQITDKRTWLEIDGPNGITFVDAQDAPDVAIAVNLGNDSRAEELALEFYEGPQIFSVELKEGFGARMSAPGYLDCTEWTVFDTAEEAEQYLAAYDDDSEEEEDRFTNHYHCDACNVSWSDPSESTNNDKCPQCNAEIEPTESEDI
jgi:hypothetical protein